MAKGFRKDRLGSEIKRIVSSMLLFEIKDPRITSRFVSITDCEVTSDGSYATCFVTVMPTSDKGEKQTEEEREESKKEVLAGLSSASGIIRKRIGSEIKIRRVPELIFKFDESMDYGAHIEEVIRSLKQEEGDEAGFDEEDFDEAGFDEEDFDEEDFDEAGDEEEGSGDEQS